MVLLTVRMRIIRNVVCFFTVLYVHTAEIIKGDPNAPEGATFSFPVNKVVKDIADDALFIGALDAGAGIFALSGLHPSNNGAQPIAPEKVRLNNEADQNNPLFNQGMALLDIIEATDGRRSPIMVTNNDLTRAHLVKDFNQFNNVSVFSTAPLTDTNNEVTQQIVGLIGFRGGLRSAALAAVTPHSTGIFGDLGSGFTTLTYQQFDQQIPATENTPATVKVVFAFAQYSGIKFNRDTETVSKISTPVTSFANTVAMEWSRLIQRGYIGLQVIGGSASSDGARSVIIADVADTGTIALRQFAPDSAFDSVGNQIIGGIGASISLSVHDMLTMETSTGLSYLIVHGGNGDPDETEGMVYALPIINARNRQGNVVNAQEHGVLASKNSEVFTFYDYGTPSRFLRRIFVTPATTPAETPRSTDLAARVGGGPIIQGTIENIIISYDAVIASVSEAGTYGPCGSGMYISRALYNQYGIIKAWTPWHRIGGMAEPAFDTELSIDTGNITYFTGADSTSINTIKRTSWGTGSTPGLGEYAEAINTMYSQHVGGVQGLIDIPYQSNGLNNISLLITTGYGMVTLTETGTNAVGYPQEECPNTSGFQNNALVFDNGTIAETPSGTVRMLTVQGGVLSNIGPVVTATIGATSTQGYLFVGGSRGLAVLSQPNGDGWDTASGLGPNFEGLTSGMSFKMLGDYQFVRDLIVDGTSLYVVTASRIDRIDISTAPLFTATTIASQKSLVFDKNDTILAGAFSGKLGLIATSKGLFRTSNGNNVSSVTSDDNSNWIGIPVPSGIVPPQQFLISSTTGLPTDFARDGGGMIELLSAYLGLNRARENRFSVKDVSNAPIDDTTVLPLPDGEIQGNLSSFITFNGFRTTFVTDGAITLDAVGRDLLISPYIRTRGHRNGVNVLHDQVSGTLIEQVLRTSASGSWVVGGDFGVRINE